MTQVYCIAMVQLGGDKVMYNQIIVPKDGMECPHQLEWLSEVLLSDAFMWQLSDKQWIQEHS